MLVKVLVETEIDKEDLFDAIYEAWVEKVNVLNFDELKASWANIKSDIIDKLDFFDIMDEVLDVYLDKVITPEFWREFREYINNLLIKV